MGPAVFGVTPRLPSTVVDEGRGADGAPRRGADYGNDPVSVPVWGSGTRSRSCVTLPTPPTTPFERTKGFPDPPTGPRPVPLHS